MQPSEIKVIYDGLFLGDLDLLMLEDALNDPDVYSAGWLSRAFNKVKGAVQKGCQYVNGKSLRELSNYYIPNIWSS